MSTKVSLNLDDDIATELRAKPNMSQVVNELLADEFELFSYSPLPSLNQVNSVDGNRDGAWRRIKRVKTPIEKGDAANKRYVDDNKTVPAGNTGEVQFNSSGSFEADSGLFWDNVNKRLGIGTASPGKPMDVVGDVRNRNQAFEYARKLLPPPGPTKKA